MVRRGKVTGKMINLKWKLADWPGPNPEDKGAYYWLRLCLSDPQGTVPSFEFETDLLKVDLVPFGYTESLSGEEKVNVLMAFASHPETQKRLAGRWELHVERWEAEHAKMEPEQLPRDAIASIVGGGISVSVELGELN